MKDCGIEDSQDWLSYVSDWGSNEGGNFFKSNKREKFAVLPDQATFGNRSPLPSINDLEPELCRNLRRRAHGPPLLEALTAEDRAALGGAERNRSFLAALRSRLFWFPPVGSC